MLKNVPLSIFLLVYIGFSLIFHQAPLVSWLNRFTDFCTILGLSALLFIVFLSFLLWVLLLTPFFIISIKLGKLIAVILLILNETKKRCSVVIKWTFQLFIFHQNSQEIFAQTYIFRVGLISRIRLIESNQFPLQNISNSLYPGLSIAITKLIKIDCPNVHSPL